MKKYLALGLCASGILAATVSVTDLNNARDHQDRAALANLVTAERSEAEKKPDDPDAQYRYALAASYSAEVAVELHDKPGAKASAEEGLHAAEKAVHLKKDTAEYYRVHGTLCGQMISSGGLSALRYGKCALDSVNKAIELDPKSAENYVSRGVGNLYRPSALGGGVDLALKDFEKAAEIDPKCAEAYMWLGVAYRKADRNADARKALEKSLELNPNRLWTKQQLEKTPAQ